MSEIPKSWFSNPRALPLNDKGQIDFSIDTQGETPIVSRPDPKTAERFMGRMFNQVLLDQGDRLS